MDGVWAIEAYGRTDWYVASSADEAYAMHCVIYSGLREDRANHKIERLDDSDTFTMDEDRDEDGEPYERTAAEWVTINGRGMLGSSDY